MGKFSSELVLRECGKRERDRERSPLTPALFLHII